MKMKTTKSSYESPLVRVRALSLERGFAGSDGSDGYGQPGEAGPSGSYDESENGDF